MHNSISKRDLLLLALDVPHFGRQKCAFSCDTHQAGLLYRATKRTILNCSRQIGKSTLVALKAVHTAHHHAGSTVIVTAKTLSQSQELIRKIRNFASVSGSSRKGYKNRVEFKNGARVLAVASDDDNVRSFSAVILLIVDEAARVPDEAYFALLPFLAVSNGALWILSTPKGRRGFFYAEWNSSEKERWAKLKLTAHECSRISPDFLREQKRRIGERRFMQDYECYFLESGKGMFNPNVVRAAFTTEIKPLEF